PQSAPTLPEIHVTHREQVREHYDRIASELDRFRQRHAYYHREIDRYYQFLVLPGSSVLEIGCGTGDTLAALRPARGVGIDLSENMTAIAPSCRSEEHTSELQSRSDLVCRLLLEKKKKTKNTSPSSNLHTS